MFFKRFFSRRQQTAATEAVSRSDQGQTGMRPGHCRHPADLEELRLLAATATNAGVREVATARYRHILAGQEASGLDLSARKEAIDRLSDHPTLDYIAKEGKEADIRLAAIGGLTDQACLAALALSDAVSSVRSAAAARLWDPEALALVARRIGKKDKNVYRLVHGRLKEMAEHESRPARVRAESEDLCNRLVGLGRFHNWSQDLALLDLIDRQWNQINEEVDETTRNRFTQERQRFLDAYEVHLRSQATEIAVVQAANASQSAREALLQELTSCLDSGDETTLRRRQAECLERWEALKGSSSDMQPQFQAAMEAIETRLQALSQERQMADHLRVWLSEATMVLGETSPQPYPRLQGLLDRLRALSQAATLDQGLAATVNDSRAQLEERLSHQRRHIQQSLAQVKERLTELESAIQAGQLKVARPLHQSIQAALEAADSSGMTVPGAIALKEQFNRLTPRLRELQKWRRWGADTHREGLCQSIKELEEAELPLAAKARRLQELRKEWQEVDHEGAPVNPVLWDQFNASAERVHEQCKPWLEQRSREVEEARASREALCTQLEAFLDQVDWARVDWRQTQRAEREIREGWEKLGEVDERHQRRLERRFRNALKQLENRLAEEREANQAFKRDLIAKVEALANDPNLDQAIAETKRLQSQWRTTVAARQREENRLWQQFRTACDVVFERRRQRQETRYSEWEENLRIRQAILSEAKELAQLESRMDAATEGPDLLPGLEARWRDAINLPIPRQASAQLEENWQQTLKLIQRGRSDRILELERHSQELLARQAQICAEVEEASLAGGDLGDLIASAEAKWRNLPQHPQQRLQRGMEARFQQACAAAATGLDLAEQRQSNARKRADICLKLEIVAGIESPAEHAADRLSFQVNRLQEYMAAGEKDQLANSTQLIERWYLTGSAPAALAATLEQRFQRILAAIRGAGRPSAEH